MLRDEDGMAPHRCLAAVVPGTGGPEPGMNDLAGVTLQVLRRRAIGNIALAAAEPESHPEWRFGQTGKHQMQRSHGSDFR